MKTYWHKGEKIQAEQYNGSPIEGAVRVSIKHRDGNKHCQAVVCSAMTKAEFIFKKLEQGDWMIVRSDGIKTVWSDQYFRDNCKPMNGKPHWDSGPHGEHTFIGTIYNRAISAHRDVYLSQYNTAVLTFHPHEGTTDYPMDQIMDAMDENNCNEVSIVAMYGLVQRYNKKREEG